MILPAGPAVFILFSVYFASVAIVTSLLIYANIGHAPPLSVSMYMIKLLRRTKFWLFLYGLCFVFLFLLLILEALRNSQYCLFLSTSLLDFLFLITFFIGIFLFLPISMWNLFKFRGSIVAIQEEISESEKRKEFDLLKEISSHVEEIRKLQESGLK